MKLIAPVLFLASLASTVFADGGTYQPWPNALISRCAHHISRDSYGRGLEAGFTGAGDLRPAWIDHECYDLGEMQGRSTARISNASVVRAFNQGMKQGLEALPPTSDSGSPAFNEGYEAGAAKLNVGSREGRTEWVGRDCVKSYQAGYARAKHPEHLATEPQGSLKLDRCYMNGFFDGSVSLR